MRVEKTSEEDATGEMEENLSVPLTPAQVKYKRLTSAAVSLLTCVVLHLSVKIAYSETRAYSYSGVTNGTSSSDIVSFRCGGIIIDDEILAEQRNQIVILTIIGFIVCMGGLGIMPVLMKFTKRSSRKEEWEIYWKGHTKLYSVWEFLWHVVVLFITFSSVPYSYCGNNKTHNLFFMNHALKMVNVFNCSQQELDDQKFCVFGNQDWERYMLFSNYGVGALSLWFSLLAIRHAWFSKRECFAEGLPCGALCLRLLRRIIRRRNTVHRGDLSIMALASGGSGDRIDQRSHRSRKSNRSRRNSPSPVYNPYIPYRSPSYRAHHPQRNDV